MTGVSTGLDRLRSLWPSRLRNARTGLLVHPASVNRTLRHAATVFDAEGPWRLTALFGPQHGIYGETQDNMVEWRGFRDGRTGIPVHSLYGAHRKPTRQMLDGLDVLVVDLQDVGSRYYTFVWTLDLCLEAAARQGIEIVILDRPNPIGGSALEGPVLDMAFASFVGRRPLPVRHGMTMGELARYLAGEFHPLGSVTVLPMRGWTRRMMYRDTGLPWVLPSPNMPTADTALVYPGLCLLEGTNLSEGRGTTRPFEIFGAPFVDPRVLVDALETLRLPGVRFRPAWFKPTFQKHAGSLCGGAQIHVSSPERFRPFLTGTAILKTIRELYPKQFRWKKPPYEYEYARLPIDILAGTDEFRRSIEEGTPLEAMAESWASACRRFSRSIRSEYLLYS